jgi:hypothetical protein
MGEEDRREGDDETKVEGLRIFLTVGEGPEIYICTGLDHASVQMCHMCTNLYRVGIRLGRDVAHLYMY